MFTAYQRRASFFLMIFILSGLAFFTSALEWQGNKTLHTLMESTATLVAVFVGILCFLHYFAHRSDKLFFIIGAGFVGTATLDFYHALVTSEFFDLLFPSPPPSLIPWSWVSSRFFLGASFLVAAFAMLPRYQNRLSNTQIVCFSGLFAILSFLFFAFYPLPRAYYPELFVSRPEELIPALMMAVAGGMFYIRGGWKENDFEYWLLLTIIVSLMCQLMFMPFSLRLFDNPFNIAHLFKTLSYLLMSIGLFISIYRLFASEKHLKQRLERSLDKSTAATQAKSGFLATMSHEIRTPLNGIVATIDLLQQDIQQSEHRELLETAENSARMLQVIIDDILDFSRIEAGKLELDKLDISPEETIFQVVDNLSGQADKMRVRLRVNCPPDLPVVLADAVRIKQILYNLIGNAIKFSQGLADRQGAVVLDVEMKEQDEHRGILNLVVRDNGIGVSDELKASLFQPVEHGKPVNDLSDGSGLGLLLTKHLVDLMSGQLEVLSFAGEGSAFTVSLPLEYGDQSLLKTKPDLSGIFVIVCAGESLLTESLIRYLKHGKIPFFVLKSADTGPALQMANQLRSERLIILNSYADFSVTPGMLACRMPDTLTGSNIHFVTFSAEFSAYDEHYLEVKHDGRVIMHPSTVSYHRLLNTLNDLACKILKEPVHFSMADRPELSMTVEQAVSCNRMVLLVDDNSTNQNVIRQQLLRLGFLVDMAQNGRQALSMWQQNQYSLILSDCHMPEMDGYELASCIRQEESSFGKSRIPMIAITADALKGTRSKCLEAGMDAYLPKPFSLTALSKCLAPFMNEFDKKKTAVSDDVDGVDTQVLIEMIGSDDPGVLSQFYREFITSSRYLVEQLHQHLTEPCNNSLLTTRIKKLHTASEMVGAFYLKASCEKVIHLLANGANIKELVTDLNTCIQVCHGVIHSIEHYCQELDRIVQKR
ncbi:response regulator [Oceanospirillum sediminis]|uniref:histidine kinase n=1 Tax=Oceanospirillum sediminis TaxID=2760088 RepID=A0A839ILF7_9GAMM|nr:response regulator [Oceanospirillum sediminis]MBB1485372.1 response regulator [Oceanospirillum sediminis]